MASFPGNKRSRKYNTSKNHWVEDLLQPATKFGNMLDPSTWVVGSSGSQPGFAVQGLDEETNIKELFGPDGTRIPVWVCEPSGDSGTDGGFLSDYQDYDPSKAYRLSVFYRRTGTDEGRVYFGLKTDVSPNVYNIVGGAGDDNPYFYWNGQGFNDGKWRLLVCYLMPDDYAGTDVLGGNYEISSGQKDTADIRTFRSNALATTVLHRAFFHNVPTDVANRLNLTKPRMELIDGTEPPLALMLAHTATFTVDYIDTIVTGSDGSTSSLFIQKTRPSMGIGDYWIDYSSGENRVFYRDVGRIVELEPHMNSGDPLASSAVQIESVDPMYRSEAQSGKRQLRSSGPQRYKATMSYPVQTRQEFRQVDAFLSVIKNTLSPFYLSIPIIGESAGWMNGTPIVSGASQSGSSLITEGWWYVDGELMVANGDWFKIEGSDKLYRATADCYADDSFVITIPITPKLQFTPANSAPLIFVNPEMKVDLVGVHKFAVKPPELYSYEIDVIEVLE